MTCAQILNLGYILGTLKKTCYRPSVKCLCKRRRLWETAFSLARMPASQSHSAWVCFSDVARQVTLGHFCQWEACVCPPHRWRFGLTVRDSATGSPWFYQVDIVSVRAKKKWKWRRTSHKLGLFALRQGLILSRLAWSYTPGNLLASASWVLEGQLCAPILARL